MQFLMNRNGSVSSSEDTAHWQHKHTQNVIIEDERKSRLGLATFPLPSLWIIK